MHGNSRERGIVGGAASAGGAQSSGRPSTPPDDPGRQDKPDGDMSSNGKWVTDRLGVGWPRNQAGSGSVRGGIPRCELERVTLNVTTDSVSDLVHCSERVVDVRRALALEVIRASSFVTQTRACRLIPLAFS